MAASFEVSAETVDRLEAKASRRNTTVETIITSLAMGLPAKAFEDFIGCGEAGRTESFDIDRDRAELARKRRLASTADRWTPARSPE